MRSDQLTLDELDSLLDDLGDELFAYLTALTHDRDRSQDILQSVFVKFIEQVGRGRILRATAKHYLMRMCRNAFIDLVRAESRSVPLPEQELPAPERQEKIRSISEQVRIVLTEALAAEDLDEEVAEILRLRLLQEADVGSICERLAISRSSAQRLMRKGMAYLAGAFRRAGLTLDELES